MLMASTSPTWANVPRLSVSASAHVTAKAEATGRAEGRSSRWVGSWYAAPMAGTAGAKDQSFRLLLRTALGGPRFRLRFSNRYGSEPLKLGSVTVGLPVDGGPTIQAGTMAAVTFRGRSTVVIPVGRERLSDPISYKVPENGDLAVSFFVPRSVPVVTYHRVALTTSWRTPVDTGDHASDEAGGAFTEQDTSWNFLTGVEVMRRGDASTVVAFGDSITDGETAARDSNRRWINLLNKQIASSGLAGRRSIVNAGLSGNMVTADRDGNAQQGEAAIRRMRWDIFAQPNVSHIILMEGINDVGEGVDGAAIVDGLRTIVRAARRRGIKVIVSPLTPSFGHVLFGTDYTENESAREPVNEWLRRTRLVDGLVEFDVAVTSGTDPETWRPDLTADLLHPNPAGIQAMASVFSLSHLR